MQIEIDDLGKRYGNGKWALRGVSATLRAGSFVALIGANGAGKTTLIHLLCGLLDASEGGVAVPPRLRLGWCSQQAVIDWYLSAYDNVLLGARFSGLGAKASRELSERALEAVQLLGVAHRPVDELSGGQQQRVQIARAMVHEPDLLLLDEPTTGLDPQAAEALLEALQARARAGAFVLVSSHDLTLLERYCDEVLLLAEGQLLAFEARAAFLERFASEEIIRVAYRGALAPADLARIRARVLRVTTESPLQVVLPGPSTNEWHEVPRHKPRVEGRPFDENTLAYGVTRSRGPASATSSPAPSSSRRSARCWCRSTPSASRMKRHYWRPCPLALACRHGH